MENILNNPDYAVKKAQEWIEQIEKGGTRLLKDWERSDNIIMNYPDVGDSSDVQSPANGAATGNYTQLARDSSTPSKNPLSIAEGLQTVINMCRAVSGYNPLDPQGPGNKKNFFSFTEELSGVPFLSLLSASTQYVIQKSHDANVLINSFLENFLGLSSQEKEQMKIPLRQLAIAALSYAGRRQTQSNFVQSVLATSPRGGVSFFLYWSEFSIIASEDDKGMIEFKSSYLLPQAEYNLRYESWVNVRPAFEKAQKVSLEDWINSMTTRKKQGSNVRALCIE
ncbi:hypothetical protein TI10_03695 [Photorhabdus luminescens subsp. luminescens]|uniref:Virulence factor Evf domain-containing protein n=1 Tax=Photorhabdus luminescens TaxID=29488 RepID=A0A1G5R2M9_PHOLU|nr:hypothetical protein [Photorhabdus luminescens]KMW74865.1 hypothetical protein TI10_03695 [Photorhabdus luminescens subsp. luminescens]SCZ68322.1 hypothetical protein SAMN02982990_02913 [Photorhabdus luminescens]